MKHFKLVLWLLAIFNNSNLVMGQESVARGNATFRCYFTENLLGDSLCKNLREFSLKDNFEATEILQRVLTPVGLRPNFVLQPCDGIKNYIATTSADGLRYIIYDRQFIKELSDTNQTNWASLSIFAHEVLHHLNQHTHIKANLEKRRQMEIEADEWSGRICGLLGATLEQAQSAMNMLQHPEDETYSSHPTKANRLAAIKRGYDAVQLYKPPPKEVLSIEDFTMQHHDFVSVRNLAELESFKQKGLFPREILNLNNTWYAFLRKEAEGFQQQMIVSKELDRYELLLKTQQGWELSSLNYRGGQWIALLNKSDIAPDQAFEKTATFQPSTLQALFAKGRVLTDLAYDGKDYILVTKDAQKEKVMADTVFITDQFPSKDIFRMNKEKYLTTLSKYLNGKWITVMHKLQAEVPFIPQAKGTRSTFPFDDLLEYDHEGFRLRSADYDGRNWVFYFDKIK